MQATQKPEYASDAGAQARAEASKPTNTQTHKHTNTQTNNATTNPTNVATDKQILQNTNQYCKRIRRIAS
jgi:hypothetical protein